MLLLLLQWHFKSHYAGVYCWIVLGKFWSLGRCLCLLQWGWNEMVFKVSSNPKYSMILWNEAFTKEEMNCIKIKLQSLFLPLWSFPEYDFPPMSGFSNWLKILKLKKSEGIFNHFTDCGLSEKYPWMFFLNLASFSHIQLKCPKLPYWYSQPAEKELGRKLERAWMKREREGRHLPQGAH